MIKIRDVAHWLRKELEGTGFVRSDRVLYAVADETWVNGNQVYVRLGSEVFTLTIDRYPEA
jgi:hypothetical protein